ncbi:MAG: hypothetical protein ACYDBB_01290 [Armatimonadota bacterium]
MIPVNWLAQLDVADRGVLLRERDMAPAQRTVLADAGLLEYAGLDHYSDCCGCEFGPGCPVERLGGTDEDPEYAAICPLGEALIYREPDLRRWRLSAQAVVRWLADHLEQQQSIAELVPRRLWEIGRLGPRVRLFLLRGVKQRDAHTVAAMLTERVKLMRGLVLVPADLPDAGILPDNTVAVSLGEVLCLSEHDVTIDRTLFHGLATQLAGEKVRATISPMSVPARFTWSQVRWEFISDEDVRIWTVGEPVVKNFQELGLINTRNGRPTKSWPLLREFAGHEGIYDLSHPSTLYAPEKIERRGGHQPLTAFSGKLGTALSDLAGHLSKLFPTIPGRPIAEYDPRKHQYRAEIRLSWEPGYRQRKATEYGVHR